MSWYLTIRPDSAYSRSADADELLRLLDTFPELRRSGPASFEAASGLPWLSLIVAQADSTGGFAVQGQAPALANVVELICSNAGDAAWYDGLASRIASSLEWEAVEEHEGRRVWPSEMADASPQSAANPTAAGASW